jgi:hypothetical protein
MFTRNVDAYDLQPNNSILSGSGGDKRTKRVEVGFELCVLLAYLFIAHASFQDPSFM